MASNPKRNNVIFVLIGIIVILSVGIAYLSTLVQSSSSPNEDIDKARLNLTSLSAYDENHALMGEVQSGQIFTIHIPIFLQANFSNPGAGSSEDIVISEIRGPNGTETLSVVQGKVSSSGYLSTEAYWEPKLAGNYTLLVFAYKPSDLRTTPPIPPIASIQIVVRD
jgi:hypothetical protein